MLLPMSYYEKQWHRIRQEADDVNGQNIAQAFQALGAMSELCRQVINEAGGNIPENWCVEK